MVQGSLRFLTDEVLRVLLVEDNEDHSNLIKMYLTRGSTQNFEVIQVYRLTHALKKLQSEKFDVALLDLSLPESQGLATFYTLHARGSGIPIVVLSGTDDELVAIEAVRGGAQDYLVKGHADHQLVLRSIRYAIERKRAEVALRRSEEHFRSLIENASDLILLTDSEGRITYASPSHFRVLGYQSDTLLASRFMEYLHPDDIGELENILARCRTEEDYFTIREFRVRHVDSTWHVFEGHFKALRDRSDELQVAINSREITERVQKERELAQAYDATLEGWSHALELRDKETDGHSKRVLELTLKLANALNIADHDLINIRRGALLHDIGKMGIPDSILQKRGELSEGEWEVMRKHPQYAYDMLFPITYLRPALDIPYCHHERWDGTGYPRGLKGEEIPLAARIFAIVDVWDALISLRPYSEPWPLEKAREHIRSESGGHFDPDLVQQFLKTF
ncbi:MAG: PAS domain S-box protein [Anaerolineae bacterium]|nr:MAG: PAS domain S-box protein [Anaerolineae bacterium]